MNDLSKQPNELNRIKTKLLIEVKLELDRVVSNLQNHRISKQEKEEIEKKIGEFLDELPGQLDGQCDVTGLTHRYVELVGGVDSQPNIQSVIGAFTAFHIELSKPIVSEEDREKMKQVVETLQAEIVFSNASLKDLEDQTQEAYKQIETIDQRLAEIVEIRTQTVKDL